MESKVAQLDIKKIINQFANLKKLAKDQMWKFFYDKEDDTLYYSPEELPKNTFLHSISKELSLYLDAKSNVHGVFIEYFSTNFLEHETEFKQLNQLLTQKYDGFVTTPENREEEVKLVANALQGVVLSSLVTSDEQNQKFSVPI